MDIHDFENNLGVIINKSESVEDKQNNTDVNLGEMNPYADNNATIHSTNHDDNIGINITEKEQLENHYANEVLKANILRAIILNNNKKKVKQMIKAGLPNNSNDVAGRRLSALRGNYVKHNRVGNLTTKYSHSNFVSPEPSVKSVQMPLQEEHVFVDISQIKSGPNLNATVSPWSSATITPDCMSYQNIPQLTIEKLKEVNLADVFVDISQIKSGPNLNATVSPWSSATITPDFMSYQNIPQPTIEKPKEVNLAEIVTATLQDVLAGKLKTVENIIGKLRVDFEEKSVFTNSKKRNIVLLNFEDDTMRPVLEIEDKYINIIQQWYNDCDILIDIEETNVSIPEAITIQDLSGILFQDVNYKFKDEYLNSYIPLVINNIISERSAKCLEKKYLKNPVENKNLSIKKSIFTFNADYTESKNLQNTQYITRDNVHADMGIVIPENILPDILKPNSVSNKPLNNRWDLPHHGKQIDPEILLKKHILADVRKTEFLDNNIYAFNEIESLNLKDKIEDDDTGQNISSYNFQYNVLYPNFGDNCLILDDIENVQQQSKKSTLSSIYVLMNDKFLQTITILDPNADIIHIIKNHPEFGFIKLFGIETNNKDIVSFIEREFNKLQFNDIEEINKKLLVTSQYIDFSNKHNGSNNIVSSEENLVKKFLNSKYNIDNDINHKMKASTLYDLIINSNVVKIDNDKISGFRTRLSKYLKDIGLQKKRYNDGFYYYGIVEKDRTRFTSSSGYTRENKLHISLEEIQKKRNEELNSF
jgi:hypothetical protein